MASDAKTPQDGQLLSPALLRRAQEFARIGTFVIDYGEEWIHLSAEMAALFRIGDTAIRMPLEEYRRRFFYEPDRAPTIALVTRARERGEEELTYESRVVRADGQLIWVRATTKPELDERGASVVVGVVQDITEIRESEDQFRTMAENSLVGVCIVQDARVVYVNSALERIFGFDAGEMLGMDALTLPHPDDRAMVAEQIRGWLSAESPAVRYETRGLHKSGGTIWYEVHGSVTTYQGRPATFGNVIDITARKQAEAALRESETRFRTLAESSVAGIYAVDEGRLVFVNGATERIFGYEPGELDGVSVMQLVHPDDRQLVATAVTRRLQGEIGIEPVEFRGLRKDGGIPVLRVQGTVVQLGGRTTTIGHLVDVTRQKEAETALRMSEGRFRTLIDSAPVAIGVSRGGKTVYVNQKYVDMFRLDAPASMIGAPIADLWAPASVEQVLGYARLRAAGLPAPSSYQATGRRADGHEFPVHAEVKVIDLPDGPASVIFPTDLTERKHAEAVLRASEARFRGITENSMAGIFIYGDDDGRLRYVNPALERLFGYEPDELLGANAQVLVHPDARAMSAEQRAMRAAGHLKRSKYEAKGVTKAGEPIDVEILAGVLELDGESVVVGNVLDITARKRGDQQLRESEQRFRTLIERAPMAITIGRDGFGTYANQRFCAMWGLDSPDDVVGHPIADMWAPEFAATIMERARARSRGEHVPASYDGTALRKNRTRFPAHVDVISAELPDGPASIAFITDLTESLRATEALRASEERLRQIAETIEEVFFIADPKRREMLYVSPAYERLTGADRGGLGDTIDAWLAAVHPDERARATALVLGVPSNPEDTFRILRADGSTRFVRVRVFPIRDASGEVARTIGSVSDITSHRELETQLRQSQKMEAIGVLAGGVAHDFNNALAVIMSYSDLLIEGLHDGDPMREDLNEISLAAARAGRMTRQLLAFSRQQVFQPNVVDLNEVVAVTASMLRRLIGEDVELETVACPTIAKVMVDVGQIEQVLMNLAVNARDAMPDGGRLRIEVARTAVRAGDAHARQVPPGEYVTLSATDSGIGMDVATCTRVFEPFFTTKPVGKGTGLGLSTVFGIVKQSGGHIEVESELDRGATFRIWLPQAQGVTGPTEVPPPERELGGTETVLIVEDEDAVRKLARTILAKRGYRVLEARSGGDAMIVCERHAGAIDLVLTDVVMPLMSGVELADRLRAMRPGLRVLFMSGYPDERGASRTVSITKLPKPFTPDSLLQQVRNALAT